MAFERRERASIYRLYNRQGELLYIGMSCNPARRLSSHKSEHKWSKEIDRMEKDEPVEWSAAEREEMRQIQALNPKYNYYRQLPSRRPNNETGVPNSAIIYFTYEQGVRLSEESQRSGIAIAQLIHNYIAEKLDVEPNKNWRWPRRFYAPGPGEEGVVNTQ